MFNMKGEISILMQYMISH